MSGSGGGTGAVGSGGGSGNDENSLTDGTASSSSTNGNGSDNGASSSAVEGSTGNGSGGGGLMNSAQQQQQQQHQQQQQQQQQQQPPQSDTRKRVKLYALNLDRQWDDRGTGHVSSTYVDRLKGISLLVRAEADGSLLLESKIQPDTAYQKQQDTLIVWSEGDNFDLALSFQEKAGCDEIWEKICQVQGKDPSVDITQDIVEESEDERFDDMSDTAPPIELPPCELSRLEEISELIGSCLTSPSRREKLSLALEAEGYIRRLLNVFHMCEDLENIEGLHFLYDIMKNIFLLNKNALFEVMFAEDTIFDVVGCLEYEPSSGPPKKHRQYLKNMSKFKEVIPISNADLLAKIHQTYRVQYIQDVVLPTPSVFEDNMLSTLSSFIFFNKVEIVNLIQEDETLLSDILSMLSDESTPTQKRRDLVMFLKEYCNFSQNLQPQGKETFYKTLSLLGLLPALEMTLSCDDDLTKSASIDILSYVVEFSPSMVREHTLVQAQNSQDELILLNVIMEQMMMDSDPELGRAVQLMSILRILIDPENMMASVNKTEKTDFLNYFYKHSIHILIDPLLQNTVNGEVKRDDYRTVSLLGLILELLAFCVEHHNFQIKNYIINKDLLRRILVLMKSSHTFLVLCALRFMRKLIALKDDFYYRYMVKGNLFAPVIDAFIQNNGRYNLLDSAIIEMFEFIKLEDIRLLMSHIVENYGKVLDEIDYVQTFKGLRLRYNQYQDKLKDKEKANTLDSVPTLMRGGAGSGVTGSANNTSRFRRDARQLEEEEEIWFNEEDDMDEEMTATAAALVRGGSPTGAGSGRAVIGVSPSMTGGTSLEIGTVTGPSTTTIGISSSVGQSLTSSPGGVVSGNAVVPGGGNIADSSSSSTSKPVNVMGASNITSGDQLQSISKGFDNKKESCRDGDKIIVNSFKPIVNNNVSVNSSLINSVQSDSSKMTNTTFVKKGLVDYEGDSDEDEDENSEDMSCTNRGDVTTAMGSSSGSISPVSKRPRLA